MSRNQDGVLSFELKKLLFQDNQLSKFLTGLQIILTEGVYVVNQNIIIEIQNLNDKTNKNNTNIFSIIDTDVKNKLIKNGMYMDFLQKLRNIRDYTNLLTDLTEEQKSIEKQIARNRLYKNKPNNIKGPPLSNETELIF